MYNSILYKQIIELSQKACAFSSEATKSIITRILNLVEEVVSSNNKLQNENQALKDEINRLKGEQGKPSIRKQSKDKKQHSSEKERKTNTSENKKKRSKNKKQNIKIDRVEKCEIDKDLLPKDAVSKGYQSVVVQDIKITTDNVQFDKKVYYSPSLKKTFIAPLPKGYHGEFGPATRAIILDLHNNSKMTLSAIEMFLNNQGILISSATISRMLIHNIKNFHQEKQNIVGSGLSSSIYQQMDDTGAKEKGKNYYSHILCNDFYTAYFTKKSKTRLEIINILTQGNLIFCFNEKAYLIMQQMKLANKYLSRLKSQAKDKVLTRTESNELLNELFPLLKDKSSSRKIILDASAIVAYQQLDTAAQILLTDDAPQFGSITKHHALCWVHDGRHYKKLNPIIPNNKTKLDAFLNIYWKYYHKLRKYKENPTEQLAEYLSKEFDNIFSTETGYGQLDERIKKTKLKKDNLLLVLKHPELPLHNNGSELGARSQARYRDISFHTMNNKGTEAKDTFMTIVETAKKLGVNTYKYLYDRVSEKYEMTSLADLITAKAECYG